MKEERVIILGAGVTGLAAGIKTGAPIYEAKSYAGGLCHSYKIDGCIFEYCGGHWIFGENKRIFNFLNKLSPLNWYKKNSAVYFPKTNLFVPYPIQKNLSFLPPEIRQKIEYDNTIDTEKINHSRTLKDWLTLKFGKQLCNVFFFPFHEKYTAGLYKKISPQEKYKTPTKKSSTYNDTFAYPSQTLKHLIEEMSKKCCVHFNKEAIKIDTENKTLYFEDGTKVKYSKIISTIPLNKMLLLCNIKLKERPDPYTSLLVINILAEKDKNCPNSHWLYIPNSKSKFHRAGFYSNVDPLFLPKGKKNYVSIYVERAFRGGRNISKEEIEKEKIGIIQELKDWKFIKEPKIVDTNFIETAYTWELPKSKWRRQALKELKNKDIIQIGRYGRWHFQGILKSIQEGLSVVDRAGFEPYKS